MTPRQVEVQEGAVFTLMDIGGLGKRDGMPIVELAKREWNAIG